MKTKINVILETIVHLVKQGKRSYDETRDICMYRGPDGIRCAAGFWIPDEKYHRSLEGEGVDNSSVSAVLDPEVAEHVETLLRLQRFHDQEVNWTSPATLTAAIYGFLAGITDEPNSIEHKARMIALRCTDEASSTLLFAVTQNWKGN